MPTYTSEQRKRRDASIWTTVQAVLAPIQFIAFIVSTVLVIRYLLTGNGYAVANGSVLIKICLLWAITITGMVWEKEIYGHYFLAPQFFWEDVGNAIAIVFHNLYFLVRALHWSNDAVMMVMVLAYCTYLINCTQFVLKGMRAGRERRMLAAQVYQETP